MIQELNSYAWPSQRKEQTPLKRTDVCENSSTSSAKPGAMLGEAGQNTSPLSAYTCSALWKPAANRAAQLFFFFCKWLHTLSPAGKNMGCWGNASKSYPSPEHFPGPDPKDRRLPQGHHHPPWATRTSETPNITCLGSTDLPLGLLGVGFWTCALMA